MERALPATTPVERVVGLPAAFDVHFAESQTGAQCLRSRPADHGDPRRRIGRRSARRQHHQPGLGAQRLDEARHRARSAHASPLHTVSAATSSPTTHHKRRATARQARSDTAACRHDVGAPAFMTDSNGPGLAVEGLERLTQCR